MTILEYAKKLNIQLNSMQLELLDLWEKDRDISAVIMFPRMSGRNMIYNLITRYEGYMQGREDAIEEFRKRINDCLTESNDFADFVVTDNDIDIVLEEMKGGAK